MPDAIDAEEFEKWMPPRDVLNLLRHHIITTPDQVSTVLSCVRAGHVRVAARVVTATEVPGDLDASRREYAYFPVGWLIGSEAKSHNSAFWQTGILDIAVPDSRAIKRERHVNLFGVRFDPDGIQSILAPGIVRPPVQTTRIGHRVSRIDHFANYSQSLAEDVRPPVPTNPRAPARAALPPKVSRSALLEWMREYGARNPGTSAAQFAAAAQTQFAGFRVTRQPIRDAIGELKLGIGVGNPTIRRKNQRIGEAD